jgi:hypothetical protein
MHPNFFLCCHITMLQVYSRHARKKRCYGTTLRRWRLLDSRENLLRKSLKGVPMTGSCASSQLLAANLAVQYCKIVIIAGEYRHLAFSHMKISRFAMYYGNSAVSQSYFTFALFAFKVHLSSLTLNALHHFKDQTNRHTIH